jgi:hypothetical protein
MYKSLICLIFVALMANGAMGYVDNWEGDVSDDYNTADNWDQGIVPIGSAANKYQFLPPPALPEECKVLIDNWIPDANVSQGEPNYVAGYIAEPAYWPVISGTCPEVREIKLANGEEPDANLGQAASYGQLTIADGGYFYCDGDLEVGNTAPAVLYITGGKFKVGDDCRINNFGTLDISGGTLEAYAGEGLQLDRGAGAQVLMSGGLMDITEIEWMDGPTITMSGGGVIKINGDQLNGGSSDVMGRIALGQIIDGGDGLRAKYDGTNTWVTTDRPYYPSPYDGGKAVFGPRTLSWTMDNLEPNSLVSVFTCDVYFGTTLPPTTKVLSKSTAETYNAGDIQVPGTYYWQIDVYDSDVSATVPAYSSLVFQFVVGGTPIINAGADIKSWWLGGGTSVEQIVGSTSEGDPLPTLLWEVTEGDANFVAIDNPTIVNPTVTITAKTGPPYVYETYQLTLTGTNEHGDDSDTMDIKVYADACEHAKSISGFAILPGDVDEDCDVDADDLMDMIGNWMMDNRSTE